MNNLIFLWINKRQKKLNTSSSNKKGKHQEADHQFYKSSTLINKAHLQTNPNSANI